ncbi:MAG: UDP-glucose/GDP-mannose dehydrogenase family protein [Eubacteriales bacterium]|nr:UDP-glucose/GDP-mannose dehydrogenase family protein [Eubacteriales bacterium]
MNIGVIGTGYVGLVQGVILAEFGMNIVCMDISKDKIDMLNRGELPIFEPGLKELLDKNVAANRLRFTTNIKDTINSDVIFIAVGTPPKDDGSANVKYVLDTAKNIATHMDKYKVIVNKSTVPVGTGRQVTGIVQQTLDACGKETDFDVVSNPEFLREDKAVRDCLTPDRIIIGTTSEKARKIMQRVYSVLYLNKTPFLFTNLETAEMIKYASNAFLAVKISFINEMALLAEKTGADIQQIAQAMGMDGRISPKFLHAGPGFGGSCFPKDTRAIVDTARQHGEEMMVIDAAIRANEKQKQKMIHKIRFTLSESGDLSDMTIGILGLSFKPDTDDIRDAPSLDIIGGLVDAGAHIRAYCPEGIEAAKGHLVHIGHVITYAANEYQAAEGADALVLVTEWNQFRGLDLQRIKQNMRGRFFFDLRNVFAGRPELVAEFNYFGVGR